MKLDMKEEFQKGIDKKFKKNPSLVTQTAQ